jgi:hypothetical protein
VRRAHLLNRSIGLPSHYEKLAQAGGDPSSELYLFDYNYIDRPKTEKSMEALADAVARGAVENFAGKTLMIACKGLHPAGAQLLELARKFRSHHLFCELWNITKELAQLVDPFIEHLYFLPVTSILPFPPALPPEKPNGNVLVSLGGDDDIDLLAQVVERCPQLRFFVPNKAWDKTGEVLRLYRVPISGPNVERVHSAGYFQKKKPSFSREYLHAVAACDTVLIATKVLPEQPMRGGIRVADGLRVGKYVVMVENPMCEALMAQHERTALVVPPDPAKTAAALERVCAGKFRVGPEYAAIGRLTDDESKLAWMIEAASDPNARDRRVFARSAPQIADGLGRLGWVTRLHGLSVGDQLTAFAVRRIVAENDEGHRIELQTNAGDSLSLLVSPRPLDPCYCRTRQGNYLRYHGNVLRPVHAAVIARVADLV